MYSFWHQSPLVRVAIAFISGIALIKILPNATRIIPVLSVVLILALLGLVYFGKVQKRDRFNFRFGACMTLALIMGGAFLFHSRLVQQADIPDLSPKSVSYLARVYSLPQATKNAAKLDLEVLGFVDSNLVTLKNPVKILAYTRKDSLLDSLNLGDLLTFRGRVNPLHSQVNPGQFDYSKYLRDKGYVGQVYMQAWSHSVPESGTAFNASFLFQNLQSFFITLLEKHGIAERELGVISALVLGKRTMVNPEVKQEFADVGVVHILAVSGLHVGIIYLLFAWVLNLALRGNKLRWIRLILIITCLWMYAGITGFSPSVLRAATMFSFVALGKEMDKRGSIYNMLALSAIVLLLFNPFLLFEVGFQLSYAAVIGIAVLHPLIYKQVYISNKILDKGWSLLVVSFTAQLATFPLALYYFGQFPTYFLISNLLVIPLAVVGLHIGLIAIVLSWIPYLGALSALALEGCFWLLNEVVHFMSVLPMAKIDHLYFGLPAVVLSYILIYVLYKFVQSPQRWRAWWPIGIATLLLCLFVKRKVEVYHTSEFALLHGSKGPIPLVQEGEEAWVFTSLDSEQAWANEAFYLDGYLGLKGVEYCHFVQLNDSMRASSFYYQNGILHFSFENLPMSDTGSIKGINIASKYQRKFNPGLIAILTKDLSDYQRMRMLKELEKTKTPYWDMAQQGVLEIPFKD